MLNLKTTNKLHIITTKQALKMQYSVQISILLKRNGTARQIDNNLLIVNRVSFMVSFKGGKND